jgi:hypothetical protein
MAINIRLKYKVKDPSLEYYVNSLKILTGWTPANSNRN